MLSILIPIYNYNAYPLASSLAEQSTRNQIDYEIICIDDASKSHLNNENEKINLLKNCTFFSNEKNLGFSTNRNFLASKSKYENLLFIDGDSIIVDSNYISKYLKSISEDVDIVHGGRIHPNSVSDVNRKLRWKYGKFVEDKKESLRKKDAYISLMFNNTLIKKKAFNLIKFDPITNKYGHDDTLFAYKASLLELKIKHIENVVMHGDIDTNESFINKTETSVGNIFILYKTKKIPYKFVKILTAFKILEDLKLTGLISLFFKKTKLYLRRQLLSEKPSLIIYKMYKIGYLCSLKNFNEES